MEDPTSRRSVHGGGTPSSLLVAARPAEPQRVAVDRCGVGVPPRGTGGPSSSAGLWSRASWPARTPHRAPGAAAAVGLLVRIGGGARWGRVRSRSGERPGGCRLLDIAGRHPTALRPGGPPGWRRVRGPAPPSPADRSRSVPVRGSSEPSCAGQRHRFADPAISRQPGPRPRGAVRADVPNLDAGCSPPSAGLRPTAAPRAGALDAGPRMLGCISAPAVLPGLRDPASIGAGRSPAPPPDHEPCAQRPVWLRLRSRLGEGMPPPRRPSRERHPLPRRESGTPGRDAWRRPGSEGRPGWGRFTWNRRVPGTSRIGTVARCAGHVRRDGVR